MSQEKTEKPTQKKREDAKKKGQFAKGSELPTAFAFLAALFVINLVGSHIFEQLGFLIESIAMKIPEMETLTLSEIHGLFIASISTLALIALPVIVTGMVAAAAGNIAQTGFTFTPEALKPKADKFSPAKNIKKIFGLDSVVNLAKSSVKLVLFGFVAYGVLSPMVINAPTLVNAPVGTIAAKLFGTMYDLALRYGLVMIGLAGADYAYAKYKHEKSLKMTKQEIRDEFKDQEGDPWIKSQRRRTARAMSQKRSMGNVPTATVVITNPTHFAVALRYERETDVAPVVVAKGADLNAKRIREIAAEHDIPLYENPPLARALYKVVEPDQIVPIEFFGAVAEILAYVYRKNEQAGH